MAQPLVDTPDGILRLIPQRPPMVMVDTLLSVDANEIEAETNDGEAQAEAQGQETPAADKTAAETQGPEAQATVTALMVRPDNIFVRSGRFLEAGIIEHVAQSAALRIGYLLRSQNLPIPSGFICSVSKVSFHGTPYIGSRLLTTVTVLQEVGPLSSIGFSVSDSGTPVADGQMKIILNE